MGAIRMVTVRNMFLIGMSFWVYVAERVPEMNPIIRAFGSSEFANVFNMNDYTFPEDRFTDLRYADALEEYETEPPVQVLFESGAGTDQIVHRLLNLKNTLTPGTANQSIDWYLGPMER